MHRIMIKAVLFDLDGVLIDSEVQDQKWTKEFIDIKGINIPIRRFEKLIGSHRKQNVWKDVIKGYENLIDDDFLSELRAFKSVKRESFNYEDILFDDVKEFLDFLKINNIRIACASSSNINYINNALSMCHIKDYFDLICTGDDFKESKPSPEIYLWCMDKFGLKNNECLVIEDSPYGIEAAKNASMMVVARKTTFSFSQDNADMIVDNLNEIKNELIIM